MRIRRSIVRCGSSRDALLEAIKPGKMKKSDHTQPWFMRDSNRGKQQYKKQDECGR